MHRILREGPPGMLVGKLCQLIVYLPTVLEYWNLMEPS